MSASVGQLVEELIGQRAAVESLGWQVAELVPAAGQVAEALSQALEGSGDPGNRTVIADLAETERQLEEIRARLAGDLQHLTDYLQRLGVSVGGSVESSAPPPRGSGSRPSSLDRIVAVATDVCSQGWQDTVAEQAAALLDSLVLNAPRYGPGGADCRALAAFARRLAGANDRIHELLAETARWLVERRVPRLAAVVIGHLVEKFSLPQDPPVQTIVRLARVAGVCLCATDGALGTCVCLADLARDLTPELVKTVLEHGFRAEEPELQAGLTA
jgi:hypothetical protein